MSDSTRYDHLPQPVMPRWPPRKLLLGQKALITGASAGIGRALALSLGAAGADVVINFASREDKAHRLAAAICESGARAIAVCADVSDESVEQGIGRQPDRPVPKQALRKHWPESPIFSSRANRRVL